MVNPTTPGLCLLLSGLQEPYKTCSSCRSGPGDCCQDTQDCYFLQEDGSITENVLLNTTSANHTVLPMALGDCGDIVVVAVGGGGRGARCYAGGAGSGYIERITINCGQTSGQRELEITVGGDEGLTSEDGESVVTLGAGRPLLEASPGRGNPIL